MWKLTAKQWRYLLEFITFKWVVFQSTDHIRRILIICNSRLFILVEETHGNDYALKLVVKSTFMNLSLIFCTLTLFLFIPFTKWWLDWVVKISFCGFSLIAFFFRFISVVNSRRIRLLYDCILNLFYNRLENSNNIS